MKCIACGKDNVQDARFCAFCGAELTAGTPAAEKTPTAESPAARQTAKPLSDNPYQPHRPAPAPKNEESAPQAEPVKESSGPRQIITPSPKRVFLFEEEEEEQLKAAETESAKKARRLLKEIEELEDEDDDEEFEEFEEFDEFDEFEEDEEDEEEDYDEEDEPTGGKIFVRVFSVLTVLVLIIGVVSFMYGTTIGRRLRASVGMSSEAEDYLILADWQLMQNSTSDASASYYNAFKLDQDNYELALTVGAGFENCGDETRAEQLYSYMITMYPQADEPYDRLMALLNRQGRTEQYEALLIYRAEHQPGYIAPTPPTPDAPVASHQSGAYTGSVQLTLSAPGGEIRYTLDGTAPTASSFLYTGPITLTAGTHNLRAVVIENGQISEEWSGSFVIS